MSGRKVAHRIGCASVTGEREGLAAAAAEIHLAARAACARLLHPAGGSARRGAREAYAALRNPTRPQGHRSEGFVERLCRWLLSQLHKPFVGQAAQKGADLIDLRAGEQYRLIGLSRVPLRGCSASDCCWGKIGRGVTNSQFSPSAVTARLARVRDLTRASPAHAKRHVGQRQFHCGKPSPAAEPRIRAVNRPFRIDASGRVRTRPANTR